MMRPLLAFLVLSPLFAAQEVPAQQQIDRLRTAWAEDLHAKKADDIVALYAPDGVFLDPTGTRFQGTAKIRTLMQQVMETYDSRITLRNTAFEASGNLAYDSGEYQETLVTRKSGATQELKGAYLTILRRGPDGIWRIVEQMWSQGR